MSNQSLREAAQQALDAIAEAHDESLDENHFECRQILMAQIKSLRAALAQPDDKAQPCGWSDDQMERFAWSCINPPLGADSISERLAKFRACEAERGIAAPQPPAEQGAELSDYPPLPEPDMGTIQLHAKGKPISMGYSEEAMRAYVDADRAGRGGVSS